MYKKYFGTFTNKLLILNTPKSIQYLELLPIIYITNSTSIECAVNILEHFKNFDSTDRNVFDYFFVLLQKTVLRTFSKIS